MQNKRNHNLLKNTFLLSIPKIIAPIIAFLLLSIYTNNISTEEYGTTDLIQTYTSLLVPILLLRLDIGMFRFLVEKRGDKKAISEIITNTVIIVVPTITIALLSIILALVFNILPFHIATIFYFLNIAANNLINPITRGVGKNRLFAIGSITGIISNFIFGILFVLILQLGGYGIMLALGISTFINNLICLLGLKSQISMNKNLLNKELRQELRKLSLPIIADGVSFWVIDTSDRTIISLFLGVATNGIYAVANKFSNLIGTISTVFWMSWSEQASLTINDSDYNDYVSKTLNSYLKILTSIAICILSIIPLAFKILIGQEYFESITYIPPLMIALLFNAIASFYGPIYLAKKKSKEIAISTTIAAIINLSLDVALIRVVGIWAAVISTVAAYIFVLAYRIINIKKIIDIKYDTPIIILCGILLIACTISYYIDNTGIICAIIAVPASIIINRKLLIQIYKTIIKKIPFLLR